ncbi:MAG: GTP-binding protein [Proteobacteria bacterium]|nr:GTP-binding protein [Pseudomonadota bacterium]
MKPIPFFLATGFLGSGKTTLLKKFIETFADDKKIAVVQNEFAEGNVDGVELRNTGKPFEILEINRGSVFCVCLLSDFVGSLKAMVDEHTPDAVILEATGLADPIAVGQLLQAPDVCGRLYLNHVWCIVDSSSFLVMEKRVTRIAHQVRVADTVVLNKTDIASPETSRQVAARISELNPHAKVRYSQFCDLPLTDLFDQKTEQPMAIADRNENPEQCSAGRPDVSSAVLRSTTFIAAANLNSFLNRFEEKAYRIKGFVNLSAETTVSVQSCFGKTSIVPVEKFFGPTELIALGPGIEPQEFTRSFEKFAKP